MRTLEPPSLLLKRPRRPLPSLSFFCRPRGGPQAFRPPGAPPDGGGGRKGGEKGDRLKGGGEKAAKEADGGGGGSLGILDTLASVAARVTLSSYHALLRASLRRALERGTWRAHACWACAGVSEGGRPCSVEQVACPALRPAAGRALEALDAAAKREKSIGGTDSAAGGGDAVVSAPPLFGSEAALAEHLAQSHGLTLDLEDPPTCSDVVGFLRRCPAQLLPAEPSAQMLDALLGVRGRGRPGRGGWGA